MQNTPIKPSTHEPKQKGARTKADSEADPARTRLGPTEGLGTAHRSTN